MSTANALALQCTALSFRYEQKMVLSSLDFSATYSQITALVGPNGAGKSTLVKCCLGLLKPTSGQIIFFDHKDFKGLQPDSRLAYVPQRESVDWDFPLSVFDVASMGRTHTLGFFAKLSKQDREFVNLCLERVGLQDLRQRPIGALSGGQQQRVFIARALAQNAQILFLDEPFAGVDAATEIKIVEVLRDLKAQGRAVIVVHHDLSTLEEYFDQMTVIMQHKIDEGTPQEVLARGTLAKLFRLPKKND